MTTAKNTGDILEKLDTRGGLGPEAGADVEGVARITRSLLELANRRDLQQGWFFSRAEVNEAKAAKKLSLPSIQNDGSMSTDDLKEETSLALKKAGMEEAPIATKGLK